MIKLPVKNVVNNPYFVDFAIIDATDVVVWNPPFLVNSMDARRRAQELSDYIVKAINLMIEHNDPANGASNDNFCAGDEGVGSIVSNGGEHAFAKRGRGRPRKL